MHALWLTVPSLAATPVTVALQGGTQLTILARPQAADVALADWIDLGSADDPLDLPGAGHLLEHLAVDAGSPVGLEAQLADWGGAVSAFTGTDYTRFNVRVLPPALPTALSALAARTLELSVTPPAHAR
ncbi:MAG: putative Zn-dependent peptidase, partial [Myxococcota bacterium]